jgi:hypothetical protein
MITTSAQHLYLLEPEVPGGWGDGTIYVNAQEVANGEDRIPQIALLHLVIDGWLGDELLTTHPCFIMTTSLSKQLQSHRVTGFEEAPMKVSVSSIFDELQPNVTLPDFTRIAMHGSVIIDETKGRFVSWSGHDICISQDASLVVTKRVLDLISKPLMSHCNVTELRQ